MIRKPEFLKGTEEARFFPGMLMTFVIALAVFAAYFVISIVAGVIYAAASMGYVRSGDFNADAYLQGVLVFSLFFEAALIACVLIYTRFIEKRSLTTLGLGKQTFALKYVAGFAAGVFLLAVNLLPAFLTVRFEYTGFQALAFAFLGAFIVQSAAEEILFRGYIITSLMRRGSALRAVLISTAAFALIHIPFSKITVLQLLGVTLLGAVLALYFIRTNNLWGAMGLHAAWNFFTCALIPMKIGPFEIGYAIFKVPKANVDDPQIVLLQFLILIAAMAFLLFAGKNRLVVRKTSQQALLNKAFHLAKEAVTDRGQFSYAMRISELAEGNEGKIVALLYHALGYGSSEGYINHEFGEDLLSAAEALTTRYGESAEDYWRRIVNYPAAVSVKNAEIKLDEMKRPKNDMYNPHLWFTNGHVQCPMMRWGIAEDECLHMALIADGKAPAGEEYMSALNREVCRRCPGRLAIAGNYYKEAQNLRG